MGVSDRNESLQAWLIAVLGSERFALEPASSDASFRRYWRVIQDGSTWIAMDAPPEVEDCGRYVDLARRFRAIGINTPEIHAEDRAQGFLLISDLGDRVYLGELEDANADRLYGDALGALATIQARGPLDGLPVYDAPFLRRELGLFSEWLLEGHLGLRLDAGESGMLERVHECLIDSALEQPRVCVHRDYHSRNLMLTEAGNPGVLDFQDAVVGPLTYDLVSLLRDCYIAWPLERVRDWALGYLQLALQSGILREEDPERFLRWFDLMGLQRHLKACGIFARLNIRDGKAQYLDDIPRTLGYVLEVADRYPELVEFATFLRRRVLPELSAG
ncbi:aminoglycoside phosphotransferase family protein [Thiocystis violacea]|uniref:aminoglycoside phosphotransferase family protein n=1 Tax=Thiocystis violacea TaxID=13725 RepID=UPI001907372E|nr:phosphotransferase [Thiocystis violacea]MBK1718053.1 aminoglycoside phosphotransferase [Thiocystis violacea]